LRDAVESVIDRAMTRFTRRAALKGLGAVGVAPLLPTACAPPVPSDPARVTRDLLRARIEHVVVLMMENRSFDHVFGALSLHEGRDDVDGLREGMGNEDADGNFVAPFRIDQHCQADPPHGWDASHRQWNEGRNDGFVREHAARVGAELGPQVMAYQDRSTSPVSYALADHYTICQRWFASVMGPTWPNRFYSLAASSDGNRSNDFPENSFPAIVDRLDTQRTYPLTWHDYYGNVPFGGLLPTRSLGDPEYVPIEQFFDDAEAGTLPSLAFLEPVYGKSSDHPPEHPLIGQILISSIYRALAASPCWKRTLFLITYDEHGGFFDHVPPPRTPDDRADEGFGQLGFRVPTMIVSPWAKAAHASDVVFDHTSTIATIARLWDLEPLAKRDAAAADVFSTLDERRLLEDDPAEPIELPVIEATEDELFVDECSGARILHRPPGARFDTGMPELEAFYDARPSTKDRRQDSLAVHRRLIDVAERLGAVRRR
jgi:phospholipase C